MAKYELLLPKMGESVAEATITKWLKNVGDHITTDDAVLEIATDKVDSEVPSPVSGRLIQQLYREDDVAQVGAVIAIIETAEPGQAPAPPVLSAPPGYTPPPAPPVSPQSIPGISQLPQQNTPPPAYTPPPAPPVAPPAYTPPAPVMDVVYTDRFYSPLVKSIASQEGIKSAELDRVPGTGAEGRLTKDDLLAYIARRPTTPFVVPSAQPTPVAAPAPAPVAPPPVSIQTPAPAPIAPPPVSIPTPAPAPVAPPPVSIPTPAPAPIAPPPVSIPTPAPAPIAPPPVSIPTPAPAPIAPPPVTIPAPAPVAPAEPEVAPAAPVEVTPPAPLTQEESHVEAPEPAPVAETAAAEEARPETEEAKPAPAEEEAKPEPTPAPEAPKTEPAAPKAAEAKPKTYSTSGGDEIIEMDRMRRIISDHMVMSKHTSAHVTSFVEVDVTVLVQWREKIRKNFENRERERITFTPIFVEAVVKAIKDFPMINVSVNGKQIIKKKDINIGMATALPSGNLIVPVIHKADELSLTGLTKAVNDLAVRARTNKLVPDEVRNGTFTITNVGSFGNVMGTPIINQPQVAILAIGVIKKKPAVIETKEGDMIAIRHMMFLSLSYDHRVVDGALGGSFVRRVADYLENWDANRDI